ncbi:parathyroid hormone-like [Perognathus longimembris pacificus]|uniref:parathyroid hormone-like n=1 Tax=Perognathus longimembris pacificus TaxID=214514 RepID=UPI00201A078F|nr:parathyroid hormone-like [Perognathus longimembris pacificus]
MAKIVFVMLAICFLTKTDGKLNRMKTVTKKEMLDVVNGFVTNEDRYSWLLSYVEHLKFPILGYSVRHYHRLRPKQMNNPTDSFEENIGETDNEDINALHNVKN